MIVPNGPDLGDVRFGVGGGVTATVRCGDAFSLIEDLDDASIDLIVTSPPYWGLREYGLPHNDAVLEAWHTQGLSSGRIPPYDWYERAGGALGREPYPDWYVAHLVEFFMRAKRTLRGTGNVWVNLGDTYFARWSSIRDEGRQGILDKRQRRRTPSGGYLHDKQLLMVPARFAIAMQDAGWILRNDVIWAKPAVMPRPESDRLRLSHEHWFHFVQRSRAGRPRYFYDREAAEPEGVDVLHVPTRPGRHGHSATFPSAVVRPRIASSCPPGGMVLDPFCGSATSLLEAVDLGRSALGFECSPTFAGAAQAAVRTHLRAIRNTENTPALRAAASSP